MTETDHQDWPRFSRPSRTASSRRGMPRRSAVEADLQNVAVVAIHQPSCFGAGKGYGPKAAHTGQGKPGLPFIGGPGCASIIGGNHHRALELLLLEIVATHIAEAKDCACNRRTARQTP